MPKYWGYNAPFLGGNEAIFSRQVDERLIKNDLLQLLFTSPGDRVNRPDFGTGIRGFLFEPMTTDSVNALNNNIINAINKWEPRVNVSSVTTEIDDVRNLLNIKIYGTFNLDRFASNNQSDLLMELNIPTKTSNPV